MIMKKVALSLLVAAASGAHVWIQSAEDASDDLLSLEPAIDEVTTGGIEPQVPTPAGPRPTLEARPGLTGSSQAGEGSPVPLAPSVAPPPAPPRLPAPAALTAPVAPLARSDVPLPRRRPANQMPIAHAPARREPAARELAVRVAMDVGSNARYADGAYTGPAADAYYGLVQVQAIVQGGRLIAIKVLQYPSDRRTSHPHQPAGPADASRRGDQRAERQRRHHFRRDADQRGLHPVARRAL